ncbi:MAG: hypothetical protein H6624_02610 [Bdellovibrionaceae bacterium]|nr:hypothetical protein [Bdellovibrionales bacterium]MCB9083203.1 hypothetical protein [Pseudobdellovibrionaceae bacterium]
MKKAAFIAAMIAAQIAYTVIFANAAFAASVQPNMYTCQDVTNPDYVVGFSATSWLGTPDFSITNEFENIAPGDPAKVLFSLDVATTPLGQIVSGVVTPKYIADVPSRVYSLVIPGIYLGDHKQAEFTTKLLIGYNGGFMPAPAVYQQITEIKDLTCTAQKVLF